MEQDDDEAEVYTWFRKEKNPKSGMGDRTQLGRIELVGGEAVTEVNSAERHKMLRKWLAKLPGVRLPGARERPAPVGIGGTWLPQHLH